MFAPTNAAFDAVNPAILKSLQMDSDLLKRVLTYHVVPSALSPSSIKNEQLAKTLAGDSIRLNVYGKDKVTVNGALKLKALEAANGQVVVIDKVLVPGDDKSSIVQVLEKKGGFTTLLSALNAADLTKHFETGWMIHCVIFPIWPQSFFFLHFMQLGRSLSLPQPMRASKHYLPELLTLCWPILRILRKLC